MKNAMSTVVLVQYITLGAFFLAFFVSGIVLVVNYVPPALSEYRNYPFQIFVSIFGMTAMAFPLGVNRFFKITLPPHIVLVYAIFIFCGAFLGEIMRWWYTVPYYDRFLHVVSGAILCLLGFLLIRLWKERETGRTLSPYIAAAVALCFATTLGVAWELIEFIFDTIWSGANSQKYALECGTPLYGRDALMDTMMDFITNLAGALPVALAAVFQKTRRKFFRWLH